MSKLAIAGGTPVRDAKKTWAKWPMSAESDAALVAKLTRTNRWSYDGPIEWQFAEAFAKYTGAKYGLCCANGTVGIQLALEALGIGAFDEVIVPGMTWQATAAAVCDVNAVPVLCDIEADTWNLDVDKAEALITKRTRAIVVVHLYGCVTDLTRLQQLCKKYKLALVEDCAHQHGTFWKDKGVGTFGDVSSFSFQESKVLSCGEGGFNTCKTKELFYKVYSLRNCGRTYSGSPAVFGLKKGVGWEDTLQSGNYRLTEWQAALLLGGLSRLDAQVKHRDAMAMYVNAQLAQIHGILPMRRRKEVTQQSYFNFTFRLDAKDLGVTNYQFCEALNAELRCGDAFEGPYDPLNNCMLYKPLTKKRHLLSKEYAKAIDPRRFKLPVCADANQKSGIAVHHSALMNQKSDMDDLAAAVRKVVENIETVRKIKPKRTSKYQALAR